MRILKIILLSAMVLITTSCLAQTNDKIDTNKIEAKALYDAFKKNEAESYKKQIQISGIATFVGPNTYALPSIEVSESVNAKGRVLCVLPFSDYFKLRKVSKGDKVVIEGDVQVFSDRYDIVVVKQCKIVEVNGKKQ